MPVLTRSGCNTGSCHGAARGKDGFRLSLFGYDPVGDYQRITREIGTRRINLAIPDQSLVYLKAIGAVPHSGGKRLDPDSPYAAALLGWLNGGALLDAVGFAAALAHRGIRLVRVPPTTLAQNLFHPLYLGINKISLGVARKTFWPWP